jgi:hypothetical protein
MHNLESVKWIDQTSKVRYRGYVGQKNDRLWK